MRRYAGAGQVSHDDADVIYIPSDRSDRDARSDRVEDFGFLEDLIGTTNGPFSDGWGCREW